MSADIWELFPYPTVRQGEFTDGSIVRVHPDCRACPTRVCTTDDRALPGEPQVCRYGITYARIDDERLIAGVLMTGGGPLTKQAKRRLRNEPDRRVSAKSISESVSRVRDLGAGVVEDLALLKNEALDRLQDRPDVLAAYAKRWRDEIDKNVQQSHDFLQLTKLVQGHAEALLSEKYPHLPPMKPQNWPRSKDPSTSRLS